MEERKIKSEEIESNIYDDWEEESKKMQAYMEETSMEQKYMKMYSCFSNFPTKIKREIITSICFVIGLTVLVLMCVFAMGYHTLLLFLVYTVITIFLIWKVFSTFFYLRHAHFVSFTGRITDSHIEGTKIFGTKHHILKLTADDGKELSFPFYGSETLNFDQYITLFININAEIMPSPYGPYVEQYIEAVPTDEIEARMSMMKDMEKGVVTADNYIRN